MIQNEILAFIPYVMDTDSGYRDLKHSTDIPLMVSQLLYPSISKMIMRCHYKMILIEFFNNGNGYPRYTWIWICMDVYGWMLFKSFTIIFDAVSHCHHHYIHYKTRKCFYLSVRVDTKCKIKLLTWDARYLHMKIKWKLVYLSNTL